MNDNEFVISFLHKPQTDITTKFYYAFTFPFTYTDCQNQLARFDTLYLKTAEEMNNILRRLNVEDDAEVDVNCNTINFQSNDSEGVENQRNHFNGRSLNDKNTFKSIIALLWQQFNLHFSTVFVL